MNEKYRLSYHGLSYHGPMYFITKWVPIGKSKENGFWQQISPMYFRKGNALRYAKRHNITLENN